MNVCVVATACDPHTLVVEGSSVRIPTIKSSSVKSNSGQCSSNETVTLHLESHPFDTHDQLRAGPWCQWSPDHCLWLRMCFLTESPFFFQHPWWLPLELLLKLCWNLENGLGLDLWLELHVQMMHSPLMDIRLCLLMLDLGQLVHTAGLYMRLSLV